jgi:hypothetical protein
VGTVIFVNINEGYISIMIFCYPTYMSTVKIGSVNKICRIIKKSLTKAKMVVEVVCIEDYEYRPPRCEAI